MQIQVTATGNPGVWTPNTLWPSKAPTKIEVLDADDSPPRAAGSAFDGMKIGRTELAALRKKEGLIVQGMDQSNAVEMTAQLAEAHAKHAEEIAGMQASMDQMAAELARLRPFEARVAEQEQTIADLRSGNARRNAAQQPSGNQQGKPQTQPQR